MDELRLSVSFLRVDVIIITESWLHDDILDNLLQLNDFDFFRDDRKLRKGGGVCIWTKPKFNAKRLVPISISPSCIEVCFLRVFCITFSIICVGIYVPPGLSRNDHAAIVDFLIHELDHFLLLFPNDRLVFAGDVNDFELEFLRENFCLSNRVTEPTRNGAFLDQVWIDEYLCDLYPHPAIVGPPLKNSDHCSVVLRPLLPVTVAESRQPTPVWDLRESNLCEFLRRLSLTDFNVLSSTSSVSVDDLCEQFYQSLSWCLSAIPCEVVYFSSRDKPWMTPILKLLIDKRWHAYRNKDWNAFAHYKAKVTSEIKKAKRIWSKKMSESPKGLWNIVRTVRGSRVINPWQRLAKEHGSVHNLINELTSNFYNNFNLNNDVTLLPLSDVDWPCTLSVDCVYQHLRRLNSRKATGPDLIPPLLFKIGAEFLCRPIACIFNASIQSRCFPSRFKHALVCPVPKTSSPTLRDFRPISLLSPLSKIFERLVLNCVKDDLLACFNANQHAYRPLGSTTTALVSLHDHVTKCLDSRLADGVNIFCLDLSKAFDQLQHHRLLNYLSSCDFNHGFLRWLLSYLSSRTMSVRVCSIQGPVVSVPSGVPQGSVLGPFLFTAFMGSVDFSGINVKCIKYADDLTIIESLPKSDVNSGISLDVCEALFEDKGLTVNRSKCKLLHVRRSVSPVICQPTGFAEVSLFKILGIFLTDRLKWDFQVSTLLKKASQRLHIIRCLKNLVSPIELARVYHAIISSMFLYASPVYGRLPTTLLLKLERFQRRSHRIICGTSTCDCELFPPLASKIEDAALKLLLSAELNPRHPLHEFVPERLPASNRLRMPPCATNRRLDSFLPWCVKLHNSSFNR